MFGSISRKLMWLLVLFDERRAHVWLLSVVVFFRCFCLLVTLCEFGLRVARECSMFFMRTTSLLFG